MHQKINYYLRKYIGIKVVASGRGILLSRKREVKTPLYVEFVGISAVGKSTIYRALLSINKSLETQKRHILKFEDMITSESMDKIKLYQNLANNKIDTISKSDNIPTDKMRLIKYFYSVLTNDYIINYFNKGNIIVSEEGLIHNFGTDISNLYLPNEIKNEKTFSNRAIIYCYSTAQQVAFQIRKRYKETGTLVPQHKVEQFDELVAKQEIALNNKRKNISFFEEAGIPVLHINTSDDTKDNAHKINQFIKDLQQR